MSSNTNGAFQIGKRIAELRKNANLTQEELAKRLSVKRETVNQWENGARQIKGPDIADLADALDTTCDYVLRGISAGNVDIHRATGLSEEAIRMLDSLYNHPQCKTPEGIGLGVTAKGYSLSHVEILNEIIESDGMLELFNSMALYLIYGEILPNDAYKTGEPELTAEEYKRFYSWANDRGLEIQRRDYVCEMYLQKACDELKIILKKILQKEKENG